MNRVEKCLKILEMIITNRLPLFRTGMLVVHNILSRQADLIFMCNTGYLKDPDRYMTQNEYISRRVDLNDLSLRPLVMSKINMFTRLRGYMGRDALDVPNADDSRIESFISDHGKVVGKADSSSGEGFRIYTAQNSDGAQRVRNDGVSILEEYIEQHPDYAAIYPLSVNTLRIHTVRNSQGIRLFFLPKLRVGGGGGITDVSSKKSNYRVLLTEDGRMIKAYRSIDERMFMPVDHDEDTGYVFEKGKQLPFVREAIDLCLKAARRLPEVRYIGWDIAVTPGGPVIVEANDISAFWRTYERLLEEVTDKSFMDIAMEMFDYAFEGVEYNEEKVLITGPFAEVRARMPTRDETFIILLQTALHRHGIEFFDRDFTKAKRPQKIFGRTVLNRQDRTVSVTVNEKTVSIKLPEPFAGEKTEIEDIYMLDRIAMEKAGELYEQIKKII